MGCWASVITDKEPSINDVGTLSGNRGLSPYLSKRRRLLEFIIVKGPKLLKIMSFMDGPYINMQGC